MIKITTTMRNATAAHIATKPVAKFMPGMEEDIRKGLCPQCGGLIKRSRIICH